MMHFIQRTGYTACGVYRHTVAADAVTVDEFLVTCPSCVARLAHE